MVPAIQALAVADGMPVLVAVEMSCLRRKQMVDLTV